MPNPSKSVTSQPAIPGRTQAKRCVKELVAPSAKAQTKNSTKPAVAARQAKAERGCGPLKLVREYENWFAAEDVVDRMIAAWSLQPK